MNDKEPGLFYSGFFSFVMIIIIAAFINYHFTEFNNTSSISYEKQQNNDILEPSKNTTNLDHHSSLSFLFLDSIQKEIIPKMNDLKKRINVLNENNWVCHVYVSSYIHIQLLIDNMSMNINQFIYDLHVWLCCIG